MALVTYKDLCIDAEDPIVLGAFWASVLGLHAKGLDDGDVHLSGTEAAQSVWVSRVPEPKSVKHRVHLDVVAASVNDIPVSGLVSAPGEFPWTTVTDPEGGEFCIFEDDRVPSYRLKDIVVDAVDSDAIAAWWAEMFGAKAIRDDGYSYVHAIPGVPFEDMDFLPVPEPKTVKNRIHWDVTLAEGATVEDLVNKGATLLRPADDEIRWSVMADPEGNEFCVFAH